MAANFDNALRTQLASRRQKLENAVASSPGRPDLAVLLHEVDACVAKNSAFRSGLPPKDDLTLMAVERID
jgi:hypothetical protein